MVLICLLGTYLQQIFGSFTHCDDPEFPDYSPEIIGASILFGELEVLPNNFPVQLLPLILQSVVATLYSMPKTKLDWF